MCNVKNIILVKLNPFVIHASGSQLNLSPTLSKILAGEDPVKVLFSNFATASGKQVHLRNDLLANYDFTTGISSELFELMLDRRYDVVLQHLLYLLSGELNCVDAFHFRALLIRA